MQFINDVALVTGAGKGFGRAIAHALAAEGAKVALVARTRKDVEDVAAEIEAAGGRALPVPADVTDLEQVQRSIAATEEQFGRITQFVNNAGIGGPFVPISGTEIERWWQAQRLHQLAPVMYLSLLLPKMTAAGSGRVVIVSARASHLTVGNLSAYIVGKTAQVRLVNTVALETKDKGVSLFAIDPGFVFTDMARETMSAPDALRHLPDMVRRLKEMEARDGTEDLRACGRRVVDLFSGRYDALTGGYFEMHESLEDCLERMRPKS